MVLSTELLRLPGRIAVVTGAAAGLGEAVALGLAGLGADLAICDRDGDGLGAIAEQARAEGVDVLAHTLDVRDVEQVRSFFGGVASRFGHVDILVNNAGGGFRAPFLEVTPGGEAALIAENYTSVTMFIREAVALMDGGGSIINITSIEAHRAGPEYATYAAMKAAVSNLTKSLALELGARNIRVNCVAPDVIPTPGVGPIEVRTPLPVAGTPDDVAAAVAYLSGDMARFVTGTTIHVDGGNDAAGGWRRENDGSYRP